MPSISVPAEGVPNKVVRKCCARVGLLGNPSDGYGGKTISLTIDNFKAEVTMVASSTVKFIPNPEGDRTEFSSMADLVSTVTRDGYDGGIKLLMATTKSFYDAVKEEAIEIPDACRRGFAMSYTTNIPRQRGLAGSSAICTAAFQALMDWHCIPSSIIPPERLAGYVLRAEQKELGIAAGLQDRVSQAFDQPVFMDFTPEAFSRNQGRCGRYETFPHDISNWLQGKLFLLFPKIESGNGKSSGKVHSPVRKLWEEGDPFVHSKMSAIANLAELGKKALLSYDEETLVRLMNENFELRCSIFGNAVAEIDKELITAARKVGGNIGAKLPGSGGAILVLSPRGADFLKAMNNLDIEAIELAVRKPDGASSS